MKEIIKKTPLIEKICGSQISDDSINYKLSKYTVAVNCDDGKLLYNTLTGQIVLLTDSEYDEMLENADVKRFLVNNYYLVDENHDDKAFAQQILTVANALNPKSEEITKFIIYPTTDCNARCFYCFELSNRRINMTEQTAKDVAKFILRKSTANEVKIDWFGGEPLFNYGAIDTICNELIKSGRKVKSFMVTNGYLFDDELVKKAKDVWGLDRVQITLDGTEKVYNKTKAYIYKDVNAFKRVIDNISLLASYGIKVQIRLNMDSNNAENLFELADLLGEYFAGQKNIAAYVAMLIDHTKSVSMFSDYADAVEAYTKIKLKLKGYGLYKCTRVKSDFSPNYCMADSDSAFTILPEGQIGKCEHYTDDHFVGDIYNETQDAEIRKFFKQKIDPVDECNDCIYYPKCKKLKNCPDERNKCTDMDRWLINDKLVESVINTYNRYKEEQK